MEESWVSSNPFVLGETLMMDGFPCRYRDDWAMRHFLHPKLLRKAREVRAQLEDIMKFQKMDMISSGTDYDVIR